MKAKKRPETLCSSQMQRKEQTIKVTHGPEVSGKPSPSRQDLGLPPPLCFHLLAARRNDVGGESVDHFSLWRPENAMHSVRRKLGFALPLSPFVFTPTQLNNVLRPERERVEEETGSRNGI